MFTPATMAAGLATFSILAEKTPADRVGRRAPSHVLHGLEVAPVRTFRVGEARRRDDGQPTLGPQRLVDGLERRMEPDGTFEPGREHRIAVRAAGGEREGTAVLVGRRDADGRANVLVAAVAERWRMAEAIGPAPQEEDDHGVAARRLPGGGDGESVPRPVTSPAAPMPETVMNLRRVMVGTGVS